MTNQLSYVGDRSDWSNLAGTDIQWTKAGDNDNDNRQKIVNRNSLKQG
jgi:hypothetical protein